MSCGVRVFRGYRPSPPAEYVGKGITNSGESPDFEGVIFSDGTVVVRWLTKHRSHSVWASWDDFNSVHGHPEYGTRIEFTEPEKWNPQFGPMSPIKPVPVDDDEQALFPRDYVNLKYRHRNWEYRVC